MFLSHQWLPRFAPWILGARLGRWPDRVPDNEISEEDQKQIETFRRMRRARKEFQLSKR